MHCDVRKVQLQVLPADEGQPPKAKLTITAFLSLVTKRKIVLRSDLTKVSLTYVATVHHMPGQGFATTFAVERIAPLDPSSDPSRDPLRCTGNDLIAEDDGRMVVTAQGNAPPDGPWKLTYSAAYTLNLVAVEGVPPVKIHANPVTAELRRSPSGDWEWEAP
jgi:hypothetical protein